MLSARSLTIFTITERQLIRQQWHQCRRTIRPFGTWRPLRAAQHDAASTNELPKSEEPLKAKPGQESKPKSSDATKVISRDHPKPSFATPDLNTLRPAGASKDVSANALGVSDGPGVMGQNDGPSTMDQVEEVLHATAAPTIDATKPLHSELRSTLSTSEQTSELRSNGAQSVTPNAVPSVEPSIADETPVTSKKLPVQKTAAGQSQPETNEQRKLRTRYDVRGTSTVAGTSPRGTAMDHIQLISDANSTSAQRKPQHLLRSMQGGRWVQLSQDDKSSIDAQNKDTSPGQYKGLPSTAQSTLIDRVVRGIYDKDQVLEGKGHSGNQTMQRVAQQIHLNGTYYRTDAEKFVKKVASMLPTQR